ncbi:MAG: hypothetical protein AAGI63_17235 [Planctomycetota bacterium]
MAIEFPAWGHPLFVDINPERDDDGRLSLEAGDGNGRMESETENQPKPQPFLTLQLVQESKITKLLPNAPSKLDFEASGVLVRPNNFLVVFDNMTSIASISHDLIPNGLNVLVGMAKDEEGFEGIAYNQSQQRYYLLVEARKRKRDHFQAQIVEYDDSFRFVESRSADFLFKDDKKGFEAIGCIRRNEQDYVLALCEGNKCRSGKKGRKPGGGRIQLFERHKKQWSHVTTVKLPKAVKFMDYSGMSIRQNRVSIVSQENSELWVGRFNETTWSWRDDGQVYRFPRDPDGRILYGNVEGVDWVTPNRIVTVSDRVKKEQTEKDGGERLEEKDQSIHIFEIP